MKPACQLKISIKFLKEKVPIRTLVNTTARQDSKNQCQVTAWSKYQKVVWKARYFVFTL